MLVAITTSVLSSHYVNFISRFSNYICYYQLCTASVPALPLVIGVFPSKCSVQCSILATIGMRQGKESKEDSSTQKEGYKQIERTVNFSLLNDVFLKF